MKRTITTISFALALTVVVLAQAWPAQQSKTDHFSKPQINTLIANAMTRAEHERIAGFYESKAVEYCAQAIEDQGMVAAYKSNSSLSTERNRASTICHCEYFVNIFNELAVKPQELAKLHEQMAKDIEQK